MLLHKSESSQLVTYGGKKHAFLPVEKGSDVTLMLEFPRHASTLLSSVL